MSSTTFTVRVESGVKKRLEKLAKSTGRSRSFLAAEALSEYLDVNEWQRDKHVEAIPLGRVALRAHQALDLFEDVAVITLGLDWRDVHDYYLQTVCASILSYCRCVPMNRT